MFSSQIQLLLYDVCNSEILSLQTVFISQTQLLLYVVVCKAEIDNNNNTNLIYIVQFDTNSILTALYIVIQ